jgi:uncharacterized sodium:solute symporter family permease YidK
MRTMAINDLLGCIVATLVLATFCIKQMVQLRALAMVSNIAVMAYGYRAGLLPILFLHMTLLPDKRDAASPGVVDIPARPIRPFAVAALGMTFS